MIDVSAQAISNYEHGRSNPSHDVVARLCRVLNLRGHFFSMPDRGASDSPIYFRSLSSATKSARKRSQIRSAWLSDIARYLSEFVEFPEADLPELGLPDDPLLLSDSEIENAAETVRKRWRLYEMPIANVVQLLEARGVIVARDALGAETLDSLSLLDARDHRPYVVIGTDKGTAVRWRFDVAHELGHLLLHSRIAAQEFQKGSHFKRIEQQAHRFAAAFLLPLAPFGDDLFAANLDAFMSIKPKWKTSIGMMIIRARHAGFLSEDTERKLWINYSRRGWRRHEPYDDTIDFERPRLLGRAFNLILDSGIQTPDDVVARLGLSRGDIEGLSGLPDQYLSSYSPVSLITPAPPSDGDDPTATPARVLQLPLRSERD